MPKAEKKRFFVFQSKENQDYDRECQTYSANCKVLDRYTVIDGKYNVMAEGLIYLDAYKMASKLNIENS